MLKRQSLPITGLLLSLVVALSACAGPTGNVSGPSVAAVDPSGELTIAMGGITITVDPQLDTAANGMHYYMAAFDGLTYINEKGEIAPALATSWKNVDPNTWDFTLRTTAKFSDGTSLQASDVAFSIRRILDPATKSTVNVRIGTVAKVEAVDANTVRITTKGPDPILTRRLAVIFIASEKAFNSSKTLVGTGPFKATTFKSEDRMVLERVDTSWRGKPKLAKITMISMPEISTRVAALKTGEVDVVHNLDIDQIQPVKASGLDVVSALTAQTCMLNLNNGYNNPLTKADVRLALNYAVDKDAIVKNVLQGYGRVAAGQSVGPDGFGHDPNIKAFPYDPAKAKSLLAQAGYPSGFTARLTGTKGYFPSDSQVIQAIIPYLQDVGVKVQLDIQETATFRANINSGGHKDMLFHCLNYFPAMDADFIMSLYLSTANFKWYSNPTFDKALLESRTVLDSNQRLLKLQGALQVLHNDPPGIYLYQNPVVFGVSKQVQGLVARPDLVMWFDGMQKLAR